MDCYFLKMHVCIHVEIPVNVILGIYIHIFYLTSTNVTLGVYAHHMFDLIQLMWLEENVHLFDFALRICDMD